MTERIVNLIEDRKLFRRMGEAGRAKTEREFGFSHFVFEAFVAYRAAGRKGA